MTWITLIGVFLLLSKLKEALYPALIWRWGLSWRSPLHFIRLGEPFLRFAWATLSVGSSFAFILTTPTRGDLSLKKFPLERAVTLEIGSCRRRQDAEGSERDFIRPPVPAQTMGAAQLQLSDPHPAAPGTCGRCPKVPPSRSRALSAQPVN